MQRAPPARPGRGRTTTERARSLGFTPIARFHSGTVEAGWSIPSVHATDVTDPATVAAAVLFSAPADLGCDRRRALTPRALKVLKGP